MARNPSFYQTQDLSLRVYGIAAIQWVSILCNLNEANALRKALLEFAKAEKIPSFVLEFALQYALQSKTHDIFHLAKSLRPKMYWLQDSDQEIVDKLLLLKN